MGQLNSSEILQGVMELESKGFNIFSISEDKTQLDNELFNAIKFYDIDKVAQLLKGGVSPDSVCYVPLHGEYSALAFAVEFNNLEAVDALLFYGVNNTTRIEATCAAIYHGYFDIAGLLLQTGMVAIPEFLLKVTESLKQYPILGCISVWDNCTRKEYADGNCSDYYTDLGTVDTNLLVELINSGNKIEINFASALAHAIDKQDRAAIELLMLNAPELPKHFTGEVEVKDCLSLLLSNREKISSGFWTDMKFYYMSKDNELLKLFRDNKLFPEIIFKLLKLHRRDELTDFVRCSLDKASETVKKLESF